MTAVTGEAEGGVFAPTAEFALFIGGAILTLVVMVFVAVLIVSIVREERAAAKEREAMNREGNGTEP